MCHHRQPDRAGGGRPVDRPAPHAEADLASSARHVDRAEYPPANGHAAPNGRRVPTSDQGRATDPRSATAHQRTRAAAAHQYARAGESIESISTCAATNAHPNANSNAGANGDLNRRQRNDSAENNLRRAAASSSGTHSGTS